MARYFIILAMLVFLAGCASDINKADRAMQKGDYAKAALLYRNVLDNKKLKAPEASEIRYNLGRALVKLGRNEDAAEEFRQAIDLKPDKENLKVYMAEAETLDAIGLLEQEAFVLRNALILDNGNPHAEAMLGSCYAKLGQFMNAREEFSLAIQHNPRDPENYLNMGLVMDKLGNAQQAVANWEEVIKLKPDHEQALQTLGFVYNRLNQYPDAVRIYSKLVSLRPDVPKFHNNLGIAFYNNRQYKEALREFQAVFKLDKDFPGIQDSLTLAKRGVSRLSQKRQG